jgi:uncharacterized protein RhaS with RHS repeats
MNLMMVQGKKIMALPLPLAGRYGFRGYDPQLGRFTEQDPLTDELATVSPYQYALNDPVSNIDLDGLTPLNLLCPLTSGFTIFVQRIGEIASQIASSPLTRALSYSVHGLSVADLVGNTLVMNDKLNNFFMAEGVGEVELGNGTQGRRYGTLPFTKQYNGPFDDETIRKVVSDAAIDFGTDIADKQISKWVTKSIMGKAVKSLVGDIKQSDGDLPIITYQQERDKQLPWVGDFFGAGEQLTNGESLRETIFHMSESRGYQGMTQYISRAQENAPLKFSAIYLTDKDVLKLEKQGSFSIRGKTVYGPGSTFPKNPNLHIQGSPFTHLIYFPSEFYRIGVVLSKFIGIVPIGR